MCYHTGIAALKTEFVNEYEYKAGNEIDSI